MPEAQVIRVQVRARGQEGYHVEFVGGAPTIPRVGEHVTFADGLGVVDAVRWEIVKEPPSVTVVCECVPLAAVSRTEER